MARFSAPDVIEFARSAFVAAGLEPSKALTVAEILVEADLMGHDTHGLQLLPSYLQKLSDGDMTPSGEPEIVSHRGAVQVWDGRYLCGVWLTERALTAASEAAAQYGMGAVTIRRSSHIACLAAYLQRITDKGQVAMITCCDPSGKSVAPFGGLDAVFTPDPVAWGIPTEGDPILIDVSASITTNGMTNRSAARGDKLKGQWLQDAGGCLTDDPAVMSASPKGTLLPTGGQDHGHKGYAQALVTETLSQGFSGFGRIDGPTQWGAAVFVQVFEPEFFAGTASFLRQATHIAESCRAARPAPGVDAVRLPGERALQRKRAALADGVPLADDLVAQLEKTATTYGLVLPQPRP